MQVETLSSIRSVSKFQIILYIPVTYLIGVSGLSWSGSNDAGLQKYSVNKSDYVSQYGHVRSGHSYW